ncbi:uncharacterized protein LOC126278883 [Schistocerca gregaria]|uniref:uncharacterized protein LOC126278883 n=1 Tax=Schistocerca gregaria TaxID=7010 RepID=UPI00211DC11B|nr:uncharacterized protein LOC126278883 [Schistocerca gregaria]
MDGRGPVADWSGIKGSWISRGGSCSHSRSAWASIRGIWASDEVDQACSVGERQLAGNDMVDDDGPSSNRPTSNAAGCHGASNEGVSGSEADSSGASIGRSHVNRVSGNGVALMGSMSTDERLVGCQQGTDGLNWIVTGQWDAGRNLMDSTGSSGNGIAIVVGAGASSRDAGGSASGTRCERTAGARASGFRTGVLVYSPFRTGHRFTA